MKIKRIISAAMSVMLAASCTVFNMNEKITPTSISASAETYQNLTYKINNNEVTITKCDETAVGSIDVPESIEGFPVTKIDEWAFAKCPKITSITLPDSVTKIGDCAFENSTSLKSIVLSDNIATVSGWAFNGCTALEDIHLPENLEKINYAAFRDCSALKTITIPEGTTTIDEGVFKDCTSLKQIIVPSTVKIVGSYAFEGTLWLNERRAENPLVILNDIVVDGKNCKGEIVIPEGIRTISDFAFNEDEELTYVNFPQSLKSIGDCAFQCTGLSSVLVPESVEFIDERAFNMCPELKSVTLSNPYVELNYHNGYDNAYLFTNAYNFFLGASFYNGSIIGYDNSTAYYYAKKFGCEFESMGPAPERTEEEIKSLLTYEIVNNDHVVIKDCSESLQGKFDIPSTIDGLPVTELGDGAFSHCKVYEITIPYSVTIIKGAFSYCPNLTDITIPSSVKHIERLHSEIVRTLKL